MPTSTSPPTTSSPRARVGRPALHGDLGRRRRGPVRGRARRPRAPSGPLRSEVGAGDDPAAEMGPVVTAAARDRSSATSAGRVRTARRSSSTAAGLVVDDHEDGFFVGPTLLDGVTPDMSSTRDEIFGPVLSRGPGTTTLDAAIDLVNANPYGNGTAVFTSSGEAARTFQRSVTRRHDRHQRADPGADGLPLVRRVEGLACSATTTSMVPRGSAFYTQAKVVTSQVAPRRARSLSRNLNFPTARLTRAERCTD